MVRAPCRKFDARAYLYAKLILPKTEAAAAARAGDAVP